LLRIETWIYPRLSFLRARLSARPGTLHSTAAALSGRYRPDKKQGRIGPRWSARGGGFVYDWEAGGNTLARGGYAAMAAAPAAGAWRVRGDGCRSGCWRMAGMRQWLPLRLLARDRAESAGREWR